MPTHPHLAAIGAIASGDGAGGGAGARGFGGTPSREPFAQPGRSTSTSRTRSPAPRASWPNARPCPRAPARGGGVEAMSFWDIVLTVAIIVGQSLLLLVSLLVYIAYALYADRKIWAAVQLRRGPNVVGPWGLLQILRRPSQVRAQGAGDPVEREQGPVPAGAARHRDAGLRLLGRDPARRGLGHRRHQCRRALHLRDLVARRVRHHHRRLGLELEIPLPRRAALGRADGVLRGLDRLRHHHRPDVRRLAQPHRHRALRRTPASASSAGTGCGCSRCS